MDYISILYQPFFLLPFSSLQSQLMSSSNGRTFVIVLDFSQNINNLVSIARKIGKNLLKMTNSNDKVITIKNISLT